MLIRPTKVAAVSCHELLPVSSAATKFTLVPFVFAEQALGRADDRTSLAGRAAPDPLRTRVQRSAPIFLPSGQMRRVRRGAMLPRNATGRALQARQHPAAQAHRARAQGARSPASLVTAVAVLALLFVPAHNESPLLDEHAAPGRLHRSRGRRPRRRRTDRRLRREAARSAPAPPTSTSPALGDDHRRLHRGRRQVLSAGLASAPSSARRAPRRPRRRASARASPS